MHDAQSQKMNPKEINIKDYSYELPDSFIAKYPLAKRDESKLLLYDRGEIRETVFNQIANEIPEESMLVFNNTKVIHARLFFKRDTGAQIEVFCIEPMDHLDYQLAFLSKRSCIWKCMVGNAKRWKEGETLVKVIHTPSGTTQLKVEQQGKSGELFIVKFSWDNENLLFAETLHYGGILPIPPYLNRNTEDTDEERYQTVYAKVQGSVAAPTAGLHFTDEVFKQLNAKNIASSEVTLHVGAGTFKPVKTNQLANHEMHEESIFVELSMLELLAQTLNTNKKIIAIGTTSIRTLESLYWHGVQLLSGNQHENVAISQWYPYEYDGPAILPANAIEAIVTFMKEKSLTVLSGSTQIIIAPGYSFQMVNGLITNFHQPENTLILLIAAFVGNDWRRIYKYALEHQFRFLSYGDSSLLWRN